MTQEALKMALQVLEDCVNSYGMKYERPAFVKAITAIKEALAQPEQEPEAWMYQEYRDDDQFGWRDEILFTPPPNDPNYFRNIVPVYTTPPQRTWVGLTDKERSELVTLHHGWNEYGQAIENKLKEKNT